MRKLFVVLSLLALLSVSAFAEEMAGVFTCEKCKHTDNSDCAKACIKGGVPIAFVTSADGKLYKIANQDKAKQHVGHKVVVTGQVSGDTLTIETVKMAKAS
jgi:hypothetical protein